METEANYKLELPSSRPLWAVQLGKGSRAGGVGDSHHEEHKKVATEEASHQEIRRGSLKLNFHVKYVLFFFANKFL